MLYLKAVITILFGCYGFHKFMEGKIGLGFAYLFTGGLLGFGWIYDSIKIIKEIKNTNKSKKIESLTLQQYQLDFPKKIDPDAYIFYHYEDVKIAHPDIQKCISFLHEKKELSFVPEPDNKYDRNALKIMIDGNMLGYVHINRIQSMILEWQNKKRPIKAYLQSINPYDKTAFYSISFYQDIFDRFKNRNTLECKLTKTGAKDKILGESRQNTILDCCTVGDGLKIDYNYDTESFVVSLKGYNLELGEISKSNAEKLLEIGDEFHGVITNMEINENDKYDVKIKVFI